MKFVIFNGPPRAGKDTAAEMLASHLDHRTVLPVIQESLSIPLRQIAYEMVGLSWRDSDPHQYEQFKVTRFEQFGGATGRDLMIDVSEKFLKPIYGQNIMAKLLWTRVNLGFEALVLIRDGGFQIEVSELISYAQPSNVFVARLHRAGCDYSSDSRELVEHPWASHNMDIANSGDLNELNTEVVRLYGRLQNQLHWNL